MAINNVSPKKGKVVDIPSTPTIGTATGDALSANVAFTAATKGGPATTYTALSNPGSITGTGSSSPINVSGLTAGTAYTFTVRGNNATGSGEYSSTSNSATPTAFNVNYLVIAGGGGGNSCQAGVTDSGGGGAGGLRSTVTATGGGGSLESAFIPTLSTNYTVTVGAGGSSNTNGTNSTFATITSTGGGRGGNISNGPGNGGSGGGHGYDGTGGSGTSGQGFAGGQYAGGGAGAAAANGQSPGGVGVAVSITGTSTFYAGGGGAASGSQAGGNGGGGAGNNNGVGTAGTANTGGGGGGSRAVSGTFGGSTGGSGVVILRYLSSRTITIGAGLTGSTTTDGSFRVTTITAGTGNVSWA